MNYRTAGVLLTISGMVGLHLGVEYSGWVVFVGLILSI